MSSASKISSSQIHALCECLAQRSAAVLGLLLIARIAQRHTLKAGPTLHAASHADAPPRAAAPLRPPRVVQPPLAASHADRPGAAHGALVPSPRHAAALQHWLGAAPPAAQAVFGDGRANRAGAIGGHALVKHKVLQSQRFGG